MELRGFSNFSLSTTPSGYRCSSIGVSIAIHFHVDIVLEAIVCDKLFGENPFILPSYCCKSWKGETRAIERIRRSAHVKYGAMPDCKLRLRWWGNKQSRQPANDCLQYSQLRRHLYLLCKQTVLCVIRHAHSIWFTHLLLGWSWIIPTRLSPQFGFNLLSAHITIQTQKASKVYSPQPPSSRRKRTLHIILKGASIVTRKVRSHVVYWLRTSRFIKQHISIRQQHQGVRSPLRRRCLSGETNRSYASRIIPVLSTVVVIVGTPYLPDSRGLGPSKPCFSFIH